MSSYTKQLMEIAAEWLAANPDPESPFLTVPRFQRIDRELSSDRLTDAQRARYLNAARESPEIAAQVDKVLALTDEIANESDNIKRSIDTVTQYVNQPHFIQTKGVVDANYHADLGRFLLAWARHGHNVLELSADFTAAILLTDARSLDIERVRLPFCGLLMLIPDGFARGAEGRSYTRIHLTEIDGRDLRMLDSARGIDVELEKYPREIVTKALNALAADAVRRAGSFTTRNAGSLIAHAPSSAISIYASDGIHTLETTIERDGLSWDAFDELPDNVEHDADLAARHTIRRIVFGSLAYIGAIAGSLERVDGSRRPRDRGTDPKPIRWTAGRTIRLDPTIVRAVRDGTVGPDIPSYRLKHRHIVRGHFRNQPYGTGRSERKEIWIAPFWKGPEQGAALVHTYKLQGARDDE